MRSLVEIQLTNIAAAQGAGRHAICQGRRVAQQIADKVLEKPLPWVLTPDQKAAFVEELNRLSV